MRFLLLQVPACPGADLLATRLSDLGIEVSRQVVDGEDLRMTGSPTLLIDGVDPFGTTIPSGLSCRLYRDETGGAGRAPTTGQLRDAVEAVMRRTAARLAWAVVKLTQAGLEPVGVERLARSVGIETAEARRVAGLIGFPVEGDAVSMTWPPAGTRPHLMTVGDRRIGTGGGCSVDAFLLAIATGELVHAESACPATGMRIHIDLTADAVLRVDPPEAVVAVVGFREADLTLGLDAISTQICAHQPFYASAAAAAGWLAEHPGGRVHPVSEYLEHAHRLVAALEA